MKALIIVFIRLAVTAMLPGWKEDIGETEKIITGPAPGSPDPWKQESCSRMKAFPDRVFERMRRGSILEAVL